jgi:hypothetical protein
MSDKQIESIECKRCGAAMVKYYDGVTSAVYPAEANTYRWRWKCGHCNYSEGGGRTPYAEYHNEHRLDNRNDIRKVWAIAQRQQNIEKGLPSDYLLMDADDPQYCSVCGKPMVREWDQYNRSYVSGTLFQYCWRYRCGCLKDQWEWLDIIPQSST